MCVYKVHCVLFPVSVCMCVCIVYCVLFPVSVCMCVCIVYCVLFPVSGIENTSQRLCYVDNSSLSHIVHVLTVQTIFK